MVGKLNLDLNLELKVGHSNWRPKSSAPSAVCHPLECEDERRWTVVGTEGETGQGRRGRAGQDDIFAALGKQTGAYIMARSARFSTKSASSGSKKQKKDKHSHPQSRKACHLVRTHNRKSKLEELARKRSHRQAS